MKRNLIILVVFSLTLVLIASFSTASPSAAIMLQSEFDGDDPMVASPTSITSAPEADDEHFVADTGGELDQYLFRTDGDGYIRFNIPITRYYFNEQDTNVAFDANGFLTSNAVDHLTSKHILPGTATLRLRAWDVDADAEWCPEVDYIFMNDVSIYENGYQSKLTGANQTWSTPSFQIPIDVLKFPQSKGTNGNPPEAIDNEIAIQIDALGCTTSEGNPAWAVEIDWGVIEISSPIRPLVFAHGWTGTTNSFDDFENWMIQDGIPSAGQVNLQRGIYPIANTATWLGDAVDQAAREFGVDELNIFAHSKGGLVTRQALRDDSIAEHTEHAITFASPHHGTSQAEDDWKLWIVCRQFSGEDYERCMTAGREFRRDRMRNGFNYTGCTQEHWWSDWENCSPLYVQQPNVEYYSFAANGDEAVKPLRSTTYPWRADAVPFPENINVNERFDVDSWFGDHSGILEEEDVYRCAISYLDSDVYASSNCPSNVQLVSNNQVVSTNSTLTEDDYHLFLSEGGTLTSGSSQTFVASLDGGTSAIFGVYSEQALTYTLFDPNGRLIDPSVADTDPNIAYTSIDTGGVWLYKYQVTTPEVGNWQNVLQASVETNYAVTNQTNSDVQLSYHTAQTAYQPGDMITLETVLSNGVTPYTDVMFEGIVTHPDDSTTTLSFYDDGSHGDATPNDGIYTSQFTALPTNGYAVINLNATKDNMVRVSEASVAITTQTAQFQQVTNEFPQDTNGNGLYDSLELTMSINVIESGHFEFQGTLIDGNGQAVTTGYFSTLMAGTGTLPTGLQTVTLDFDGNQIYQHGIDGPYTLTNLTIFDVTESSLEVDSANNFYTTTAYQANQFERPLITLTDGSELPMDYDSNGRYDVLQINLDIEVVHSGSYDVNGKLVDPHGREIVWGQTNFYASSSGLYSVQLEFDGYDIGTHGVNGPYTLRDLSIFNTSDTSSAIFGQAYTTQAYSFTEFEGGFAKLYLPIINNSQTTQTTCAVPPILLGPANNSNLSTISPLFQWDSGNDPDATAFRLQLATDSNFTQLVTSLWSSGTSGPRDFRFAGNFESSTTYYWRAWLECDQTDSPYSDVWSFTTGSGGIVLPGPGLIAPANGSIMPSSPVTLQWSPVGDALEYLVRWRQLGYGGYTYSWVDGTERDVNWLDPNVVYEWWTSARNDYAIGADSATWQFTSPSTTSLMWSQGVPDGFVKIEVYDDGEFYTFIEPE